MLIVWKWSKSERNVAFGIIKNPFSLKATYCSDIFIHSSPVCLCLIDRVKKRLFITILKPKWKKSILFPFNYLHAALVWLFFTLCWMAATLHSFFTSSSFCFIYLSFVVIYVFHPSISSLCLELVANYIWDAGSLQSDCLDIILWNHDYRKNWLYRLFCVIDSSPFQN